jgi:4-hydroxy-3-methylbut-2-enyl diphosphate reductase
MKKFDIPLFYRSSIIGKIKEVRESGDRQKKDYSPSALDFGPIRFLIARHFGFCYGVENAIEIAYKTIEKNPGKRIFLLSEMIHNPGVNSDLSDRGISFLMDTSGNKLFDWNKLTPNDIVIIPAFGTTLEIETELKSLGINAYRYNTTCPFVEKVWNRSKQLGTQDYTVIIHGKHYHEETRATFSHGASDANALIVRDIEETKFLGSVILGERSKDEFYSFFRGKHTPGFEVGKHLTRVGVVNQTTMLASETQAIADYLKNIMIQKYGEENLKNYFADTRDTLCYATNDNQDAALALRNYDADFAIVVGGYNSSNTSHLVELCEEKFTTYFISSSEKIISNQSISHFDIHSKSEKITKDYLPKKRPVKIALTSGASCPDAVVDEVIQKLVSFFDSTKNIDDVVSNFITDYSV